MESVLQEVGLNHYASILKQKKISVKTFQHILCSNSQIPKQIVQTDTGLSVPQINLICSQLQKKYGVLLENYSANAQGKTNDYAMASGSRFPQSSKMQNTYGRSNRIMQLLQQPAVKANKNPVAQPITKNLTNQIIKPNQQTDQRDINADMSTNRQIEINSNLATQNSAKNEIIPSPPPTSTSFGKKQDLDPTKRNENIAVISSNQVKAAPCERQEQQNMPPPVKEKEEIGVAEEQEDNDEGNDYLIEEDVKETNLQQLDNKQSQEYVIEKLNHYVQDENHQFIPRKVSSPAYDESNYSESLDQSNQHQAAFEKQKEQALQQTRVPQQQILKTTDIQENQGSQNMCSKPEQVADPNELMMLKAQEYRRQQQILYQQQPQGVQENEDAQERDGSHADEGPSKSIQSIESSPVEQQPCENNHISSNDSDIEIIDHVENKDQIQHKTGEQEFNQYEGEQSIMSSSSCGDQQDDEQYHEQQLVQQPVPHQSRPTIGIKEPASQYYKNKQSPNTCNEEKEQQAEKGSEVDETQGMIDQYRREIAELQKQIAEVQHPGPDEARGGLARDQFQENNIEESHQSSSESNAEEDQDMDQQYIQPPVQPEVHQESDVSSNNEENSEMSNEEEDLNEDQIGNKHCSFGSSPNLQGENEDEDSDEVMIPSDSEFLDSALKKKAEKLKMQSLWGAGKQIQNQPQKVADSKYSHHRESSDESSDYNGQVDDLDFHQVLNEDNPVGNKQTIHQQENKTVKPIENNNQTQNTIEAPAHSFIADDVLPKPQQFQNHPSPPNDLPYENFPLQKHLHESPRLPSQTQDVGTSMMGDTLKSRESEIYQNNKFPQPLPPSLDNVNLLHTSRQMQMYNLEKNQQKQGSVLSPQVDNFQTHQVQQINHIQQQVSDDMHSQVITDKAKTQHVATSVLSQSQHNEQNSKGVNNRFQTNQPISCQSYPLQQQSTGINMTPQQMGNTVFSPLILDKKQQDIKHQTPINEFMTNTTPQSYSKSNKNEAEKASQTNIIKGSSDRILYYNAYMNTDPPKPVAAQVTQSKRYDELKQDIIEEQTPIIYEQLKESIIEEIRETEVNKAKQEAQQQAFAQSQIQIKQMQSILHEQKLRHQSENTEVQSKYAQCWDQLNKSKDIIKQRDLIMTDLKNQEQQSQQLVQNLNNKYNQLQQEMGKNNKNYQIELSKLSHTKTEDNAEIVKLNEQINKQASLIQTQLSNIQKCNQDIEEQTSSSQKRQVEISKLSQCRELDQKIIQELQRKIAALEEEKAKQIENQKLELLQQQRQKEVEDEKQRQQQEIEKQEQLKIQQEKDEKEEIERLKSEFEKKNELLSQKKKEEAEKLRLSQLKEQKEQQEQKDFQQKKEREIDLLKSKLSDMQNVLDMQNQQAQQLERQKQIEAKKENQQHTAASKTKEAQNHLENLQNLQRQKEQLQQLEAQRLKLQQKNEILSSEIAADKSKMHQQSSSLTPNTKPEQFSNQQSVSVTNVDDSSVEFSPLKKKLLQQMREESSFLPDQIIQAEKEKKQIVKKVRFHDDEIEVLPYQTNKQNKAAKEAKEQAVGTKRLKLTKEEDEDLEGYLPENQEFLEDQCDRDFKNFEHNRLKKRQKLNEVYNSIQQKETIQNPPPTKVIQNNLLDKVGDEDTRRLQSNNGNDQIQQQLAKKPEVKSIVEPTRQLGVNQNSMGGTRTALHGSVAQRAFPSSPQRVSLAQKDSKWQQQHMNLLNSDAKRNQQLMNMVNKIYKH